MFKKEIIHRFKSIRFRRWSHKNFAVFAGLKANISIGQLAKGIADRLLPKTKTLEISQSIYAILNCNGKSIEELLSTEDSLLSGIVPVLISPSSFKGAAVAFSINRESKVFAYYGINKIIKGVSDYRYTRFV